MAEDDEVPDDAERRDDDADGGADEGELGVEPFQFGDFAFAALRPGAKIRLVSSQLCSLS